MYDISVFDFVQYRLAIFAIVGDPNVEVESNVVSEPAGMSEMEQRTENSSSIQTTYSSYTLAFPWHYRFPYQI